MSYMAHTPYFAVDIITHPLLHTTNCPLSFHHRFPRFLRDEMRSDQMRSDEMRYIQPVLSLGSDAYGCTCIYSLPEPVISYTCLSSICHPPPLTL